MKLYNALSRRKEELPAKPGPIGMYFCGPTVYQRIHIGNARPYAISMWLKRWLESRGYQVKLVENITDINDKIYDAARAQGIGSAELAAQATDWYIQDTQGLGLGRPDVEPLASETLDEIIGLISELVDRGLAYESQGDVCFRVSEFPDYGILSGANLDEMVSQEPGDLKEDPRDFSLWKATKPAEDTAWDSPWGRGRPGWHIECSAMAEKHLGRSFAIHGGGLDLRFPHHENEIAQSRGAGREFARLWAHNGMLELREEKMSKSVGNIVSLREALDAWGREAILVFFLTAHYRSPLEYSDEAMEAANAQAVEFRTAYRVVVERRGGPSWDDFAATLDDDFNTPTALAILHEWRRSGRTDLLGRGLELFGLSVDESPGAVPADVVRVAELRRTARQSKDFEEADRLRGEIDILGWEVQDVSEEPGYRLVPKESERT